MEYRRQEPVHSLGTSGAEASPAAPGAGFPSFPFPVPLDVRGDAPSRPAVRAGRSSAPWPGGAFESPRPWRERLTGSHQVARA